MAGDLKKLGRANKAPIWTRLAKLALKPTSARRVINVKQLARHTQDGNAVAFPGKVLGVGSIDHAVSVFAFSISDTAADKIVKAGGSIIPYADFVQQHPTGKEVVLLG